MTFKSYLNNLNDLAKSNPDLLNLPVIYGRDEEGNAYNWVCYTPSIGNFDDGKYDVDNGVKNAICIN